MLAPLSFFRDGLPAMKNYPPKGLVHFPKQIDPTDYLHICKFTWSLRKCCQKEGLQMFRRERKVIVEVSSAEYRLILASLLALRNMLISEGRCTDPVDELLMKLAD